MPPEAFELQTTPVDERLEAATVAELRSQRERIEALREDYQKAQREKEELQSDLDEALAIEDQLRARLDSIRRMVELTRQASDDDPVILALLRSITTFTNNIPAPALPELDGMVGLTD